MNKKIACVFIAFVVGLVCSFADDPLIDVVRMKDGETLEGMVVDQNVGVSLKLATADGLVYTLENSEIESVRKRKIKEPIPFSYKDVIMLKDGVVFRGIIVEQQPEKSLVLQMENEINLTFGTEEIWKIIKEKQVTGVSIEKQERQARAEREGIKLQFQIEITRNELMGKESARSGSTQASGDLGSEIDRLNDEVKELESAEQEAVQRVVDEHRSEEREEIEKLQGELKALIDELQELLDQCEDPGQSSVSAKEMLRIEAVKFQPIAPRPLGLRSVRGFANDSRQNTDPGNSENEQITARMEASLEALVGTTLQKLPTQEEIDVLAAVQQARIDLAGLLESERWWRAKFGPEFEYYVTQLTVEDRLFLYDTHKRRDVVRGVALNIVPFLYLGCWAQRDWLGALVGYTIFLGSVSLAGALGQVQLWFYAPAYGYGLIEPFLFTYMRNSRMKRKLQVDAGSIREEMSKNTAALSLPVRIESGEQRGFELYVELVSLRY